MALLAGVGAASLALSLGVRLGPQNCVSLSRSAAGTCVIGNACEGVDTSSYEYAFNCWNSPRDLVRHSFGLGGFDADEEFDTSVPCERCEPPTGPERLRAQAPKPRAASKLPSLVAARTSARLEAKAQFGPGRCVSTWREEKSSHCIMMTNCTNEDMGSYEYGLVCVDKDKEPVKHLFGKGSFDPEEVFDTLLVCAECKGLDESGDGKLNATAVVELEADVKELAAELKSASQAIVKLNKELSTTTAKPATTTKKATSTTTKPAALLHKGHNRHREVPVSPPAAVADDEEVAEDDAGSDDGAPDDDQ